MPFTGKYQWHTAASSTCHLHPLAAQQEPFKKKTKKKLLTKTFLRIFWGKVWRYEPSAEKNDKTESVRGLGRKTREEIGQRNQMTALIFLTGCGGGGGGNRTFLASPSGWVQLQGILKIIYKSEHKANSTENDKTERVRGLGRKTQDRKEESNDSPNTSDGGGGWKWTFLASPSGWVQLQGIPKIINKSEHKANSTEFFFLLLQPGWNP